MGKSYRCSHKFEQTWNANKIALQQKKKKTPLIGLPSQGNSLDGSFLHCFVDVSGLLELVLYRLGDSSSYPPRGVTCISGNGRNIDLSERGENWSRSALVKYSSEVVLLLCCLQSHVLDLYNLMHSHQTTNSMHFASRHAYHTSGHDKMGITTHILLFIIYDCCSH